MSEREGGWVVKFMSYETGEAVKVLGPFATKRRADRADSGANINLNHEKYYTLVVVKGEE